MTTQRVSNHVELMLDARIEQFRDKTRFAELASIYGRQIQALEDALIELLATHDISIAEGAQLDGIGAIVGEERASRTDDQYRIAIQSRIALNTSSGTIEDLIQLSLAVTSGTQAQLIEYFPASFVLQMIDPIPATVEPSRVQALVTSAKPAGVGAVVVLNVTPAFSFDSGSGFDTGKYAVAV